VNVVCLVAHPDDELMCAGTLARFAAEGNRVRLFVLFTDERQDELEACAKTLGVELHVFARDEARFGWCQEEVRWLEPQIGPCDLLISHRVQDNNSSHAPIGQIARTLARKNRMDLWELDQCIPGGFDPDARYPNHFVDITVYAKTKWAAIDCYASQLERYPGLEGVLHARDQLYGWQAFGPDAYAEGFRVVRSCQ